LGSGSSIADISTNVIAMVIWHSKDGFEHNNPSSEKPQKQD
jgi:hypothetical protein